MDWSKIFDFAGIAALIVAIVSVIKSFRMQPYEAHKEDANAAKVYMEAAKEMAEEKRKIQKEFDDFKKDVNKQMELLEVKLDARDKLLREWANGIDQLIGQLCNKREVPTWQPRIEDIENARL